MHEISLITKYKQEIIDITDFIQNLIPSDFDGIGLIYTPHTTCAITINEGYDPDVKQDIINFLSYLVPADFDFKHFEGNSDAHIKSSLIGVSQMVIIENGKLVLGTWQKILFCEFDGPRKRKVLFKLLKN